MRIETCTDAADVARRCADLVAETLLARPDAVILLPAGRTPEALYAELVRRARAGAVELGRARWFQLDELIGVGPEDERSFHRFLRRRFAEPLAGDGGNDAESALPGLHLLDGTAEDPAAEIARHAFALGEACDGGTPDLSLLGIGTNGHLAFNEPGSPRDGGAGIVELAETTLAGLANSFERVPTRGITLGLEEILSARRVVLLATGAAKRAILRRALLEEATEDVPASLLQGHPDALVLADEAAASELRVRGS